MALVITLLPNATGNNTNWINSGESTDHECLDDDNGDSSYVSCGVDNAELEIEFQSPSAHGVVEADIMPGSISIAFISSGRSTHRRGDPALVDIAFDAPWASFTESCSYDAHASSYETINGTTRSTNPLGGAWTYTNLENMGLVCTKDGGFPHVVRLTYLALRVLYTSAAADNATFFGANF
mgnify:CR=1 FL=1